MPRSGSCFVITLLTKNCPISKYKIRDLLENVALTIRPMTQEIAAMVPRYDTSVEPFTSVILLVSMTAKRNRTKTPPT